MIGQPLATRLFTAAKILAIYLRLLVFPVTLSADYSYRQVPLASSVDSAAVLTGFAVAVSLGGALLWAFRKRALPAAFAISFFAATYAVVGNLLVPLAVLVAERLMYLPSLGFCAGVAWVGLTVYRRYGTCSERRSHRIVSWGLKIALILLVLFYSGRTFVRNLDWWSGESLFAATARASPECHAAHFNYAAVLLQSGRSDVNELALQHLLKADEIRNDHYPTLVNLTVVYLNLKQPEKARETALRGLRIRPESEMLKGLLDTAEKEIASGGSK